MWYIHHVGFNHNGSWFTIYERLVQSCDGSIIVQPVIAPHYAEAENMPLLVQNVQSFSTGSRRETGDDSNLSETANLEIPTHEASADEVLVDLGLVESPNQRPDNAYRRIHLLYHNR